MGPPTPMVPGGSRTRWLTALASVTLLALVFVPMKPPETPHWGHLLDAGHLPLLAAFAVLVYGVVRRGPENRARSLGIAGAISVAVVVAIELLQPLVGRSASLRDGVIGLLGIAAGLSGIVAWSNGRSRWPRVLHGVALLAVLVGLGQPAWAEWRAVRWRELSLPLLADFEEPREMRLWAAYGGTLEARTTIRRSREHPRTGAWSLEVHTGGGHRGRGVVYDAGTSDWSRHRQLVIPLHNPGAPLRIVVHVFDGLDEAARRGSFRRVLSAEPGWNELRIPIDAIRRGRRGRTLELAHVRRMMVSTRSDEPSRTFHLDHLRLE